MQHSEEIRFPAIGAKGNKFIAARPIHHFGLRACSNQLAAMTDHLIARLMSLNIIDSFQTGNIAINDAHGMHRQIPVQFG